MSKRTFKEDKLAKIYDAEVVPIWSRRFGRMMLRELTVPNKAMVLDVNCGSGYPSLEILKRMDEQGRIIAIDSSSPLLDEARTKAGKLSGKRIFFRSESTLPKLPFAEEVYDLVVANAGLQQLDDPEPAVRECARVTKVGGQVIATYPLAGTFGEFYDLFREVLIKGDYKDALDRLDAYLTRYPPLEQAVAWFEDAGLGDVQTEFESFTLLFKSSREFFFAPMIEYGPLSSWKNIAGKGQQMQDVFWQTKAAIDAYFQGSAFSVTVFAGCLRGRKLPRDLSVQVPGPDDGVVEPSKGQRASSSNPHRATSRPSGQAQSPEGRELPDAPSDEVDALSGSWPMPMDEPPREQTGTGTGEPKWEIADLHEPHGEYAEEPPTVWGRRRPREEGGPTTGRGEDQEEIEPLTPRDPDTGEEVQLGTGEVEFESQDDDDELLTGEVQLGTAEIEVVHGAGSATVRPGVRRVRRPGEPDDPDIL